VSPAKPVAAEASPICRCEDEPHPSCAIVLACSRVATNSTLNELDDLRLNPSAEIGHCLTTRAVRPLLVRPNQAFRTEGGPALTALTVMLLVSLPSASSSLLVLPSSLMPDWKIVAV
jgi:hypothetical protein